MIALGFCRIYIARKSGSLCRWCKEPIIPGTHYSAYSRKAGKAFYAAKLHMDCVLSWKANILLKQESRGKKPRIPREPRITVVNPERKKLLNRRNYLLTVALKSGKVPENIISELSEIREKLGVINLDKDMSGTNKYERVKAIIQKGIMES